MDQISEQDGNDDVDLQRLAGDMVLAGYKVAGGGHAALQHGVEAVIERVGRLVLVDMDSPIRRAINAELEIFASEVRAIYAQPQDSIAGMIATFWSRWRWILRR